MSVGSKRSWLGERWPWITATVVLLLILITLVVVIPKLDQAKYYYRPSGYVSEIRNVPQSVIKADGWIDPDRMRAAVEDALTHTVAALDTNEGLVKWKDVTAGGSRYEGCGGKVTTTPSMIPPSLLVGKAADEAKRLHIGPGSMRQFHVRYWTEKYPDAKTPGPWYVSIEVYVSTPGIPGLTNITDPYLIAGLTRDFIDALQAPEPRVDDHTASAAK